MVKLLSPRRVKQIYDMARNGSRNTEIAKTLRVHRNCVMQHLGGHISYDPELCRSLGLRKPLEDSGKLDMLQAAAWIPGHPSPSKMQRYVAGRTWSGRHMPALETCMERGHRFTTHAQIKDFVSGLFPSGIWISQLTLSTLAPYVRFPLTSLGWIRGEYPRPLFKGETLAACRLATVADILDGTEYSVERSSLLIHRATKIHEKIGTAVV